MIEVCRQLDDQLRAQLQAYLDGAAPASGKCPEHDLRWLTVLKQAFGHRPVLLIARGTDEKIVGYLPLAEVSSLLFGRFLVSLPYLNRAGVVAEDELVRRELIHKAAELTQQWGAGYLELRHHLAVDAGPDIHFNRNEKQRLVLNLPESDETLWSRLKAKVRNQVRKAEQFDLQVKWGTGRDCPQEILEGFYNVFAHNMRDLGTPVYGRELFESILNHFDGQAEIGTVWSDSKCIGGGLLIHASASESQPAITQVPSASTLRAFNHTNANMWLYWQFLQRAIERGSQEFDFGRSSEGSGTYRFKKQWGAEPEPTVWQYHIVKGDVQALRPDSEANAWKVNLWKKLPVSVTRWVGPAIVRGIP